MGNENTTLGKASLWTSIIGVVLPVSLAVVAAIFIENKGRQETAYALSGVLFLILELIAFGCGVATRRTATGKAGLVISGILLLLVCIAITLVLLLR